MRTTFLKGALAGGIAGTVCAAAAVALAGTGIGSVFNLGQTNSVDARSMLTGQPPNAASQLIVQNAGTGRGVAASSAAAGGVRAVSTSDVGVAATSSTGYGVSGTGYFGVRGESSTGDGVF